MNDILTSSDGIIRLTDDSFENQANDEPHLNCVLAIKNSGEVETILEKDFLTLGRSGHAQVGINVIKDGDSEKGQNSIYEVPIRIEALGEQPDQWIQDLIKLTEKGIKIKIGRLLSLSQTETLNKNEITDAIRNNEIACHDKYQINDDGSISIKLNPREFILNQDALSCKKHRRNVLIHGRGGLNPYLDTHLHGTKVINPNNLSINGIALSTGPYGAVIRSEVNDQGLRHLEGAVYFDPIRSSRIHPKYKDSSLRQIELFNNGNICFEKGEIWITIDFYKDDHSYQEFINDYQSTQSKKNFYEHGVSFIKATKLENPDILEQIFNNISPIKKDDKLYGRVITREGVTPIEWSDTLKFQQTNTLNAVNNPDTRQEQADLNYFVDGIGVAKDHGRVLISNNLPQSHQLINLVNSGVTSFIFKGIKTLKSDFAGDIESLKNNVYLDSHLYETILELSQEGIAFSFITENEDKRPTVREFYKGFWVNPEAKSRFDQIECIIDMYGWHGEKFADMSKDSIRGFFNQLIKIHGKDKIAIAHGKGPGLMLVADEIARDLGIFSIGVGINVERIGQAPNFKPEAILDFDNNERLPRQKLLDQWGLVKVFNIGGYGTEEESSISKCSIKLGEVFPTPLIYIDESDGPHLWENAEKQSTVTSTKKELTFKKGNDELIIDLTDYPLGPAWVSNTIECVNSYEKAGNILEAFFKDPITYWTEKNIIDNSKENPNEKYAHLILVWEKWKKLKEKYELKLPKSIKDAMRKILQEIDDYRAN